MDTVQSRICVRLSNNSFTGMISADRRKLALVPRALKQTLLLQPSAVRREHAMQEM